MSSAADAQPLAQPSDGRGYGHSCTGRPVEATAIGNLLVQAETCGRIKNKNEIQIII